MRCSATLAFLALAAAPALADGPHRAPPEAAFQACAALAAGAACTVAPPDRPPIAGQCAAAADERLFCRPDRPPHDGPGHPPGPPPEALAACRGRAERAACAVETPDGAQRAGLCGRGREGALACWPEPPAEAFAACARAALTSACTVTPPHAGAHAVSGRCEAWADQRAFCRPDRPPRGRRGPPPEAFSACGGRAAGDACAVTPPDRPAISGHCHAGPDERLVCRPDRPCDPPPARE